ncbi:MAG: SPOR domain-containing protein [Rhodocyclaceae bacterium]|nr:SPOR domain-containing protein [Rhodocyclaceae bacterium]
MTQTAKPNEVADDASTALARRARRRLIGAAALALAAAIVLPLVMDHRPPPQLSEIQLRIPSPDDASLRPLPSPLPSPQKPESREPMQNAAGAPQSPGQTGAAKQEAASPQASGDKTPTTALPERMSAGVVKEGKEKPTAAQESSAARWEVQLGAYQNAASVANLVAKLRELGLPSYTEKVMTPKGERTRVRAGPFPDRETAEKARLKIKTLGVDGVVATMPAGQG